MRSSFFLRGAVAALLLAVVGLCVWLSGAAEPGAAASSGAPAASVATPPPAGAPAELARVERELATMRSELAALRGSPTASGPEPQGDPAPAALAGLSAEEELARRAREEARVFAKIGAAFAALPPDPAWSETIHQRLDAHLRDHPLPRSSVEDIQCRADACRIEISLEEGADLEEIRDSFRYTLVDVMGSGASKRDDNGRLVLYLAKDPPTLGM